MIWHYAAFVFCLFQSTSPLSAVVAWFFLWFLHLADKTTLIWLKGRETKKKWSSEWGEKRANNNKHKEIKTFICQRQRCLIAGMLLWLEATRNGETLNRHQSQSLHLWERERERLSEHSLFCQQLINSPPPVRSLCSFLSFFQLHPVSGLSTFCLWMLWFFWLLLWERNQRLTPLPR